METILLFVFLGLLVTVGVLILTQGMIEVSPRNVSIRRNQITGGMKELTPFPALHLFLPGLYYILRTINCKKTVHDPDVVRVTTRDGQEVDVDYVLTLWCDYFDERDKPIHSKAGNAIRLATTLEEGKEVEAAKNHTHAAVQRMFGNIDSYQLLKRTGAGLSVFCPDCNIEIPTKADRCPNKKCKQGKAKVTIPGAFYDRQSWAAGVRLDDYLEEKYGLACWLEIQNVRYVGALQQAARAETMGKMEGRATKARLDQETAAMKNLFQQTNVNPTFGFAFAKLAEVLPEILAGLTGKKKGGSSDE